MRPIDADAVCERCRKSGAICTGNDCEIPTMPTLTPPNEWVSVEERLPEERKNVLCCTNFGQRFISRRLGEKWDSFAADSIAHWMPLPEPPKEG